MQKTREGKSLPSKNKLKTIKKMVIGSYISIITLNVNGLNAPTKIQTGWADENMYMYTRSLTTPFYLYCNYFIL